MNREILVQRGLTFSGFWFVIGNFLLGVALWPSALVAPSAMHEVRLGGVIPVMANGWHLYMHLITGLACLLLARRPQRAFFGTAAIAAFYVAIALVGLATDHAVFSMIMVNRFGSWVHLVEGVALFGVALFCMPWPALRWTAGLARTGSSGSPPTT